VEKQVQNPKPGTLGTTSPVALVITSAIRRPTFLVASSAAFIGAGLYLNWPAVVTLGLAPLILTFAPCALMCAFGLCAMSGSKNKTDNKPPTQNGGNKD
jgi:hypothetical protein